MAKKAPQKFDGDIVLNAQGHMVVPDYLISDNLFWKDPEQEKFIPMPSLTYLLQAKFIRDNPVNRKDPLAKRIRAFKNENVQDLMNRARNLGSDKKLEHSLRSGRCKMSVLLNSPGGWSDFHKMFKKSADALQNSGGQVASFGADFIGSAAAYMFMAPPRKNRFVSPLSTLMFHLPSNAQLLDEGPPIPEYVRLMEETRQTAETTMSEIILNSLYRYHRAGMKRKLKQIFNEPHPASPDRPFAFDSGSVNHLGIGKETEDIEKAFQAFHATKLSAYAGTPIQTFFETEKARLEEKGWLSPKQLSNLVSSILMKNGF